MRTALITAIGSFSADIVIKNLKKIGFRVIGTDIYPKEWVADAYFVNEFYKVPKAIDETDFLERISEICKTEKITHILPSTDIEVDFFNKYRNVFEEAGICICISSRETIELCRNKKAQQQFIDARIPSVRSIPTEFVHEYIDAPFDYPMIAKLVDGRSSQGLRRILNPEDWNALRLIDKDRKYVVQPLIEGEIVTVDVVKNKSGTTCVAIPRLELLRTLNGAGTSVKVFPDRELENISKLIADAFNIIGCVNFEFLRDVNQNYHFVECNPRFSGGVEFSCLAGYDCVSNHIRCFNEEEIDYFELTREIYIARKYEEYVTRVD